MPPCESQINDIALCCFVKNEERNIGNMLNSATKYVSEIYVCDTGSTDGTLAIAERFTKNITVAPIERIEDFAAIRNEAFAVATARWILMLDGDEVLSLTDRHKITELIRNTEHDAWFLPRRNWNPDNTYDANYPDWQGRLFLNNGKIKYEQPVHEHLAGYDNIGNAEDGPHIEHYNRIIKTQERITKNHLHYIEISKRHRLGIYGNDV